MNGTGYSPDEFRRIQDAAEPWNKPMLLVAYHTGMRKGEIRALRWDQVDVRRGTIRLKSSDTKTDEGAPHSSQSVIDKRAQSCYKIRGVPMGIRESRMHEPLAREPEYR
jgi:integrase